MHADPGLELGWIAKRTGQEADDQSRSGAPPIIGMAGGDFADWLENHPVDALVDFSSPEALHLYGEEVHRRKLLDMSGDEDSWPELLQALEAAYPILPLCCHAAEERRYAEFLPRLKRGEHPANLGNLERPHFSIVIELLQLMRLYHLVCMRSGNPDQAAHCVLVALRLRTAVLVRTIDD